MCLSACCLSQEHTTTAHLLPHLDFDAVLLVEGGLPEDNVLNLHTHRLPSERGRGKGRRGGEKGEARGEEKGRERQREKRTEVFTKGII